MTDKSSTCPYCGHTMRLIKRKNGIKYVNEGMDGPVHWVSRMTYRYYMRCHNCNARGPLTVLPEQARQDAGNRHDLL